MILSKNRAGFYQRNAMILILGLNPVWQKVLTFNHFRKDGVNRATAQTSFASGKGINMARALQQLDAEVHTIQPIGGVSGKLFLQNAQRIGTLSTISMNKSTRLCTTCIDGQGGATEIIEPSPTLTASESRQLLALVDQKSMQADMIILAGTIPAGINLVNLSQILKGKTLLIDNAFQAETLLEHQVGDFLKINADELNHLVGQKGIAGIKVLITRYPHLKHIAITNEADPTYLYSQSRFHKIEVNGDWPVLNPIGAGDVCSAVWAYLCSQKQDPLQAFVTAQASARASCLTKRPGEFSLHQVSMIEQQIQIIEVFE
jgi:fructose-1-phosphate kinase PfkB-like protein